MAGGRSCSGGGAPEIVRGPRRALRRRAGSRIPPPAALLRSGGWSDRSPARPSASLPARPAPLRPPRPPSLSPLPGNRARLPGPDGERAGRVRWRRGAEGRGHGEWHARGAWRRRGSERLGDAFKTPGMSAGSGPQESKRCPERGGAGQQPAQTSAPSPLLAFRLQL